MRSIRFGELEVILAVARHRNFRSAAEELGVTTSAISQTIGAFEQRIGVLLFHRTTRSVSLTETGRNFTEIIGPALLTIQEAIDNALAQSTALVGKIRINSSIRGIVQAMPMLTAFMKEHPTIDLELKGDDRLIDIIAEGYDIGIRLEGMVVKDMIAVPFGKQQRHVVVGSPRYLLDFGVPEKPQDLVKHRTIGFRGATGLVSPWRFSGNNEKFQYDPTGNLIVDSSYLAREAVLADFGLAYCSEAFVQKDILDGTIIKILGEFTPQDGRLNFYYSNRRNLSASLKALIEFGKRWVDD